MACTISKPSFHSSTRSILCLIFALGVLATAHSGLGQDTPLISGGAGLLTETNGGKTTYNPIIEPLLAAQLGKKVLVESRAALLESFSPKGGGQPGYDHSHFIGLTFLQGDYIATPHATVVGGEFLIPFNTYNERLTPIWIGNFQDAPLIFPLGLLASGGLGGMVRGNAIASSRYSINYNYFYSTRSGNEQFSSSRGTGGRVGLYLPEQRLEAGFSYDRILQGTHENFYGTYVWWEPEDAAFRLRSEFGRGEHAQGYWVEADYRTRAFGGLDSIIGRFEPVLRIQQTFRLNTIASDGLPPANTQRADFGLNYNLPHDIRILTSYARQFSTTGNHNVWETGIVYRFLFPAWKGRE
ncbi:MAG: hypothetical protein ABSD72_02130 [Terracidiphilus sp.]|jgi:hypothetical protein